MTARIYAIANRKGGCGKTTTAYSMGVALARMNFKVLLVDMDPQGDLTDWARVDPYEQIQIYDALVGYAPMKDVIRPVLSGESGVNKFGTFLYIAPTDTTLWNFMDNYSWKNEHDLKCLKNALDTVKKDFDFIIIDTPPSFGVCAYNAYVAATNGLIVATDTSRFALRAMEELVDAVENVRELNESAYPVGVLITRFNGRSDTMKGIVETTKDFGVYWNLPVYEHVIRQTTSITDAQVERKSIYAIHNTLAAHDYSAFVEEFLKKEGIKKPNFKVR